MGVREEVNRVKKQMLINGMKALLLELEHDLLSKDHEVEHLPFKLITIRMERLIVDMFPS